MAGPSTPPLSVEEDLEDEQILDVVVTPLGLLPLAQHCPHLETLVIFFNASGRAPRAHEVPSDAIDSNSVLERLHIGDSILQPTELAHLAGFLVAVFPALTTVSHTTDAFWYVPATRGREQARPCDKLRSLVRGLREVKLNYSSSIASNIVTNINMLQDK